MVGTEIEEEEKMIALALSFGAKNAGEVFFRFERGPEKFIDE